MELDCGVTYTSAPPMSVTDEVQLLHRQCVGRRIYAGVTVGDRQVKYGLYRYYSGV